ncbi:MAG: hypothetical protein OXG18_08740, partial [Gemmatimonadetes bacterium]|nr:hypothetical protein [Gemmatimonadota bacterium]
GLWLRHGLRGGGAAPETEAVPVATRLFRCLSWHLRGLGCAIPSQATAAGRYLRVQQSFAGRPEDARGGGIPTLGKPDRRLEPAVSTDGG